MASKQQAESLPSAVTCPSVNADQHGSGSRNAPIFVGGGVAHGPHPHSHAHSLPKKVRALAMKHALSAKVKDEALIIVDALEGEKTKDVSAQLKKLGIKNALVIGGAKLDEKFAKASLAGKLSIISPLWSY